MTGPSQGRLSIDYSPGGVEFKITDLSGDAWLAVSLGRGDVTPIAAGLSAWLAAQSPARNER